MVLKSYRLTLIPASVEFLKAAIESKESLSVMLGVTVPDKWTEFGMAPLQYSLDMLTKEGVPNNWNMYFPVLTEENILVGNGGFTGKPVDGTVELGYEIAEDFRNKGLATEYVKALIDFAFDQSGIKVVSAHTLSNENPSTSVLKKCGFIKTEEIFDTEDGNIWRWELQKPLK